MKRNIVYLIASIATLVFMAVPALAQGLTLSIEGVRNAKGSVIVMVFDKAGAYNALDWSRAVDLADLDRFSFRQKGETVPTSDFVDVFSFNRFRQNLIAPTARPGRLTHRFADLKAGPYAVLLFHDENGDQDLNFSGDRLLEGIGASGVTAANAYPAFADAAVPPGPVTVRLHYDR